MKQTYIEKVFVDEDIKSRRKDEISDIKDRLEVVANDFE